MKGVFYSKLARTSIKKNSKLYIPYIITCVGIVMMYYIMLYLMDSSIVERTKDPWTLKFVLGLGSKVIAVFSAIFLFYTNSFLMRRRKKEFGLYNILGMNRINIAKILFWETIIIYVIALGLGLGLGILFSKMVELIFINMIREEVSYTFFVSAVGVLKSFKVFGIIFLLLFLNALRQLHFTKAIDLLHSENVGEKPPRANWLWAVVGTVILGVAYYIALAIKSPISSMIYFFVAVIMVIVATYLLFVSGSVFMCKLLQKNKKYYYNSKHFVSVSSMAYRMKRNGAGLASICIMATMILVMLASAGSLYFGMEDCLRQRYPRNINLEYEFDRVEILSDEVIANADKLILDKLEEEAVMPVNILNYQSSVLVGYVENGRLNPDPSSIDYFDLGVFDNILMVIMMPVSDYNRIMGTEITLAEDEALMHTFRQDYAYDTIQILDGKVYKVTKSDADFTFSSDAVMDMVSSVCIVVNDYYDLMSYIQDIGLESNVTYDYCFDLEESDEYQTKLTYALSDMAQIMAEKIPYYRYTVESVAIDRADFYTFNGGLLFLGGVLSMVFLVATVLIIYYKQISEGYEDQSRFEIMQKVGMTGRDIKKSINSQMLTVFILPIAGAVLHFSFAFPMLRKLLLLFGLNNTPLFITVAGICIAAFALFYMIVYKFTSNAYYSIVKHK